MDLKDTQDYFLGSGEPCCLAFRLSVCLKPPVVLSGNNC